MMAAQVVVFCDQERLGAADVLTVVLCGGRGGRAGATVAGSPALA
jgi:hypothetical protein